jgi:outer membrane lipase/esterase
MKRLRLVGVLLVLVGVVVAPIGARGPHFLRFFVFGDSLSDTGNDFILSSALGAQPALPPSVSPNRTYFNGRFSNGPVAVEYLWGRLNSVPVSLIPPSLADRRVPPVGAVSFAFGVSGSGVTTEFNGVQVPGLGAQIELFRQGMRGQHAPPHSLFLVFTGASDYLVGPGEAPLNPVDVVNNIGRGITALYALGARVIVIPNLPDLGAIPVARPGSALAQGLSQLAVTHNQLLALKLQILSLQLPGIQLVPVDLHSLTPPPGTNVTIPALDVLVPTTPPAVPTSLCIFANPAACPNVPTFAVSPVFFFWDAEHPTTASHSVIGRYLHDVLLRDLAEDIEDDD